MSPKAKEGSHWKGFSSLRYLFVFGASYCSVGYYTSDPEPTDEEPLGVPFPGTFTWTTNSGVQKPNWVGHLVMDYSESRLLVYDYAVGGQTVDGLVNQVREDFKNHAGRSDHERSWTAENSLFVTWIGINDVAIGGPPQESLDKLFLLQDELYRAGARNFLFINVPPPPRTHRQTKIHERINHRRQEWNDILERNVSSFADDHSRSSAFLFDAHAFFTKVLNGPKAYGFSEGSGRPDDGEMYWDHLHPTSAFHKVIAQEIGAFLSGKPGQDL